MSEDKIQLLLDRQEIHEVIALYAYSLDARDWLLYRSCFAVNLEMDYSASIGSGGLQRVRADDWVSGAKQFFENLNAT